MNQRYLPLYGCNTKQWWIYDEETDVYIDPPAEVLKKIKYSAKNIKEQESLLEEIINENPDWLQDEDYWYDEVDI